MNGELPADSLQTAPADPLEILNPRSLVQNPTSDVLRTDSLNLCLSTEQAMAMSRSILDIFELEETQDEDDKMGEDDDEEEEVDLEDQQRRTERLKGALSILAQLWWADSDQIDLVAGKSVV